MNVAYWSYWTNIIFFNNIIILFPERFWGRYLLVQPLDVPSVPASVPWQVDVWHSQGDLAAVCPRAGRKHPNYTARYMSYEDSTDRAFCYSPSKVTIYKKMCGCSVYLIYSRFQNALWLRAYFWIWNTRGVEISKPPHTHCNNEFPSGCVLELDGKLLGVTN